jgi:hypothetical protein
VKNNRRGHEFIDPNKQRFIIFFRAFIFSILDGCFVLQELSDRLYELCSMAIEQFSADSLKDSQARS